MFRTSVCCAVGFAAAKFLYDELKRYEFEKIVFVDPDSDRLCVNIKANRKNHVVYVCGPNVTINENVFVKWVKYRIKHPVTGFFIWKLLKLPEAKTYEIKL
jgi:hypothetical protein